MELGWVSSITCPLALQKSDFIDARFLIHLHLVLQMQDNQCILDKSSEVENEMCREGNVCVGKVMSV
jgi:hypothetical protein